MSECYHSHYAPWPDGKHRCVKCYQVYIQPNITTSNNTDPIFTGSLYDYPARYKTMTEAMYKARRTNKLRY